ncbi:CTP synthase [Candidatus Marsarchaeota archaeon]|nr:CTP synthase [Candidatus Marsarchaeota archaeon]MCL5100081.1 CTP synthase [Candidatus Marsarchaeota archaeon]
MPTEYIVVMGSLLSGIGKGIVTASLGKMLAMHGLRAMPMKFDGYLNYDCGTMNPFRHGEVYVLDDKSEVDMDFGTYERFLNVSMTKDFSMTGGKLFSEIIKKERNGDFLGRDVQIIPHLTDLILEKIEDVSKRNRLDVMLIEVGGTVGDIENSYFVEAMRQLALRHTTVFVNVVYVPELGTVGEQKTKPTQIALRSLMQSGVQPHFIVCRSERQLGDSARDKIALFSNLTKERIIDDHDAKSIYSTPQHFMAQRLDKEILHELGFEGLKLDNEALKRWNGYARSAEENGGKPVNVAIVGKYVGLHDSYASVKEALVHAGVANRASLRLDWIESEELEGIGDDAIAKRLGASDCVLVPGGFGNRGIEGMINAIRYARAHSVPFLGLCLGMQLMTIEYARNVCMLKDANSSEFNPKAKHKVIDIMEDQLTVRQKGGTMRLGAWPSKITKGTMARKAYGKALVYERHRHRYEFNNAYRKRLENAGLVISATTPDNRLVEIIEWKGHFGIGTQAHPELKSRPEAPAPLFVEFISNAMQAHPTKKP